MTLGDRNDRSSDRSGRSSGRPTPAPDAERQPAAPDDWPTIPWAGPEPAVGAPPPPAPGRPGGASTAGRRPHFAEHAGDENYWTQAVRRHPIDPFAGPPQPGFVPPPDPPWIRPPASGPSAPRPTTGPVPPSAGPTTPTGDADDPPPRAGAAGTAAGAGPTATRPTDSDRRSGPGGGGIGDPLDPPPWVRPSWADGDPPPGPFGGPPPSAAHDERQAGGARWTGSDDPGTAPPRTGGSANGWSGPRDGDPGGAPAGDAGADEDGEDELLPPAGTARRGQLAVARLQPANVRRLVRATPVQPAGKPPGSATAAGVLCGILAVPMLATTGALFATRAHPALAASTFVVAILSVLGGIRLIQRGSPLLPLLCAAFSVLGGVLLISGAVGSGVLISVIGTVWLLFTALALIMVLLLRRRRVRRWLTARGREWQRGRPAPRRWRWRRRVQLPDRLRFGPRLRSRVVARLRPAQRRTTRRPAKVKRVGRHVRGGRSGSRSGPVGFVGRDSPDRPGQD